MQYKKFANGDFVQAPLLLKEREHVFLENMLLAECANVDFAGQHLLGEHTIRIGDIQSPYGSVEQHPTKESSFSPRVRPLTK